MSIEHLITNWVNEAIRNDFYVNEDEFRQLNSVNYLVFVASLWSGNSQMAFRDLCDVLHQRTHARLPVLVLDGDSERLRCHVPDGLQHECGDGLLLFFTGDRLMDHASGVNRPLLRQKLAKFTGTDPG